MLSQINEKWHLNRFRGPRNNYLELVLDMFAALAVQGQENEQLEAKYELANVRQAWYCGSFLETYFWIYRALRALSHPPSPRCHPPIPHPTVAAAKLLPNRDTGIYTLAVKFLDVCVCVFFYVFSKRK